MIIRFCEKRFSPLYFALLLHLAIIFIFYLNSEKLGSNDYVKHISEQSTTVDIGNKYLSTKLKDTNIHGILGSSNLLNGDTKRAELKTSKEQLYSYQESKKVNNVDFVKSETMPNPRNIPQEYTHDLTDSNLITTTSKDDNNLDSIKKDIGLLSIDVPKQQHDIKTNKEYLILKIEAEKINTQLSNAVNEVKERNQQEINQMQQQDNIYHIQND